MLSNRWYRNTLHVGIPIDGPLSVCPFAILRSACLKPGNVRGKFGRSLAPGAVPGRDPHLHVSCLCVCLCTRVCVLCVTVCLVIGITFKSLSDNIAIPPRETANGRTGYVGTPAHNRKGKAAARNKNIKGEAKQKQERAATGQTSRAFTLNPALPRPRAPQGGPRAGPHLSIDRTRRTCSWSACSGPSGRTQTPCRRWWCC